MKQFHTAAASTFSLSKNPLYLTNTIINLSTGLKPFDAVHKYASYIIEVLIILRENFPSRVLLFSQISPNSDAHYLMLLKRISQQEILRREVSALSSRVEIGEVLKIDEVPDVFSVLKDSLELSSLLGASVVCSALKSATLFPPIMCSYVRDEHIELLEHFLKKPEEAFREQSQEACSETMELEELKEIAKNFISRVRSCQVLSGPGDLSRDSNGVSRPAMAMKSNEAVVEYLIKMKKSIGDTSNANGVFLQKVSHKTLLFQLNESNNIEKVVSILLMMSNRDSELLKLANSSDLSRILVSIIDKYIDGFYGYDTTSTPLISYSLFHQVLLGLFCKLGEIQRVELTRALNSDRFLVKLGLIIEDGSSHIIENYFNLSVHSEADYAKFYESSIRVLELAFELGNTTRTREVLEVMSDLLKRIKESCGSQKVKDIDFLPTEFKLFVKDLKEFLRKSEIQHEVSKKKETREGRNTAAPNNAFSNSLFEHDRLNDKSVFGRLDELQSDRSLGNYLFVPQNNKKVHGAREAPFKSTVSLN